LLSSAGISGLILQLFVETIERTQECEFSAPRLVPYPPKRFPKCLETAYLSVGKTWILDCQRLALSSR
jgi:hypothetical protein